MSWDPREVIAAKRDGRDVRDLDLERLIAEYAAGALGDGPMAAFLMAALLRGLNQAETSAMTRAFVSSGLTVDLGDVGRPVVDKHSTGGVADAVSLVFAPLVAALGLACVKVSGRGLGHTGGTIDKLESIPGFRADLSVDDMRRQAASVGAAIASQTSELVPADGMVYALRDATATVASTPLIAASVMSKKLAVASDLIVLDVKHGVGAFMPTVDAARSLAGSCLALADAEGRRAIAAVTEMSQPLGTTIGNALEVAEAIEVLHGRRTGRLRDLAAWFAARSLALLGDVPLADARAAADRALADGSAVDAFRAFVEAQGGDPRVVDDPEDVLPRAPVRVAIPSPRAGFVERVDARAVGAAAATLGAGRHRKGAPIDPAVGIVLHSEVGDHVEAGEEIGIVHARTDRVANEARDAVLAAIALVDAPTSPPPLVALALGEDPA